ncbi:Hypothetical_protein [Hexamita inflata]|uniref:Hypothetical_protein n=1 Tax=Hexamita inflata TaxID=28002 RepID=A0ABP1I9Z2_9EUKA
MNFINDKEQKVNFNKTFFTNTSFNSFINYLSKYKEKSAACYGEQYIAMSDSWLAGIDDEIQNFIENTYQTEQDRNYIKIEHLFEAIDKTFSQISQNELLRIYKEEKPFGTGYEKTCSKTQIILEDVEYLETSDYAIELIKKYPQITKHNQLISYLQILIVTNSSLKNPVSRILQQFVTITEIKLDINEYIAYQLSTVQSTAPYNILPQSEDCFKQDSIQICTKISQMSKQNVSILCSSIPIKQVFASKYNQYIVDTEKEIYLTKSTSNVFHYKYFLSQLDHQQLIHINKHQKAYIISEGKKYIIQNFDGFIRLIFQIRDVDTKQHSISSAITPTTVQFTFDECITDKTTGYILNTNQKYKIDCLQPQITFEQIQNNQIQNLEASLLLSDLTFSQMYDLSIAFGPAGTSIGRIARNNMSIIYTNMRLSQQCQDFIEQKIYDFPNNPDYNTYRFNLDQLFCFYEQDGIIQSQNYSFLIKTHSNMLFTDFVIFPSTAANYIFHYGEYNVITTNSQTIFPIGENHMQVLFSQGALICKLYDQPDYLYKRIQFGNFQKLNSKVFRQLDYLNAIVFKMQSFDFDDRQLFSQTKRYNCSLQTFSNEIMKNSQPRPEHYFNTYQPEVTPPDFIADSKQQYVVLTGVFFGTCILIILRFCLYL